MKVAILLMVVAVVTVSVVNAAHRGEEIMAASASETKLLQSILSNLLNNNQGAAIQEQAMAQKKKHASPILLIPGLMGSRFQVKDTDQQCSTKNKFVNLWYDMRLVEKKSCTMRQLPLLYNSVSNSFQASCGVEIKVPYFGGLDGVEYVNSGKLYKSDYYHNMIAYFEERGYVRDKSIRSAPYDWRVAAEELQKRGYYRELKGLVEEMYKANGNTKVTLVVHGVGGPVSLYFLTGSTEIDQAWKDRYIHAYIPLSGSWSGGVHTLAGVIIGTDIHLLANSMAVPIFRSFESSPWMIPKSTEFGRNALVVTPKRSYTANDYEELFRDIGYTNGYTFIQRVQSINEGYPAPNVPTYCYYGVDVKTPEKYTFSKNFVHGPSPVGMDNTVTYGNGDGSVNIQSSEVCHKWSSMRGHHFEYKTFCKINHMGMVKDDKVFVEIARIVNAPQAKEKILVD